MVTNKTGQMTSMMTTSLLNQMTPRKMMTLHWMIWCTQSWFQCADFGQYSFAEAQHITRKLHPTWAEAVGIPVLREGRQRAIWSLLY
eukprot:4241877-Ditylum_brightwellii.AAC.1